MIEAKLEGDGEVEITGMAGLAAAQGGEISFLANPRYAHLAAESGASAIIAAEDWNPEKRSFAILRVKDPDAAFAAVAEKLGPPAPDYPKGVHPSAVVHSGAIIGSDVAIGPCCVVEEGAVIGDRTVLVAACYIGRNSKVGEDCLIYPHASLRERVTLGNRVILHNGVVVGSDGFGYTRDSSGWRKIRQVGTVEIGDDVEIGANSTIDRARFGKTVIGKGVKIDNLVQVAHNVTIGENTAMAAQVGISGSTSIGRDCMLGGQAGAAGHIEIGDGVIVGAKGGVTKSIPDGEFVSDFPAIPHAKAKRMHAHIMRLPEMRQKLKALEEEVRKIAEG